MKDHKHHLYKRTNLAQPAKAIENGKSRLVKKRYIVFKCQVTNCNHYKPKHLIEGTIAECPKCHEPFVIDKIAAKLAWPHCRECTTKKIEIKKSTLELLEDLAEDLG